MLTIFSSPVNPLPVSLTALKVQDNISVLQAHLPITEQFVHLYPTDRLKI